MKKRILSVLLSMVVATTISSAVPMSVQAETLQLKRQYNQQIRHMAVIQIPEKLMQKISKSGETRRMRMMSYQVGIISKEKILDGRVSGYKHIMNRVLVTMF